MCPAIKGGVTGCRYLPSLPYIGSLHILILYHIILSSPISYLYHLSKMAYKVPRIPSKRGPSSPAETPSASPASHWPSSSLIDSSPTPHIVGPPKKRVSLIPPSLKTSSVPSYSPIRNAKTHQQQSISVPRDAIEEGDAEGIEEDDSMLERIMAVDMRDRGSIGCCYYTAANETLYLLEDIKSGGLETIDLREYILKFTPHTV